MNIATGVAAIALFASVTALFITDHAGGGIFTLLVGATVVGTIAVSGRS
jgi:hypothetical protein